MNTSRGGLPALALWSIFSGLRTGLPEGVIGHPAEPCAELIQIERAFTGEVVNGNSSV